MGLRVLGTSLEEEYTMYCAMSLKHQIRGQLQIRRPGKNIIWMVVVIHSPRGHFTTKKYITGNHRITYHQIVKPVGTYPVPKAHLPISLAIMYVMGEQQTTINVLQFVVVARKTSIPQLIMK